MEWNNGGIALSRMESTSFHFLSNAVKYDIYFSTPASCCWLISNLLLRSKRCSVWRDKWSLFTVLMCYFILCYQSQAMWYFPLADLPTYFKLSLSLSPLIWDPVLSLLSNKFYHLSSSWVFYSLHHDLFFHYKCLFKNGDAFVQ